MDLQLGRRYTQNGLDRAIDIFKFGHRDYTYQQRSLAFKYLYQYGHT